MVVVLAVMACHIIVAAVVVMLQWLHGRAVVVVMWHSVSGGSHVMVVTWQVVMAHCSVLLSCCITLRWQW